MRSLWKKAMSFFLAATLVVTLILPSVTTVAAVSGPTEVAECTKENLFGSNADLIYLKLQFQDSSWIGAITGVSAGGESYRQQTSEFMMSIMSDPAWYAADNQLQIVWDAKNHSELTVSATGYEDTVLLLSQSDDSYSVSVKKDSNGELPSTPDEGKQAPTDFSAASNWGYDFRLTFSDASDWLKNISSIQVNGSEWTKGSSSYSVWNNDAFYVDSTNNNLYIGEGFSENPATCVITAEGYKPLTLKLDKTTHTVTVVESGNSGDNSGDDKTQTYQVTVADAENGSVSVSDATDVKAGSTITVTTTPASGYVTKTVTVTGDADGKEVPVTKPQDNSYTFQMPEENVTIAAVFESYQTDKVSLSGVRLESDYFGNNWNLIFDQPQNYVSAVTGVKVNGTAWNETPYSPSGGGSYKKNVSDNTIIFAQKDYSGSGESTALKSGDVVTVTADGYEDFIFKLVIDTQGKATLTEDDGQGDPYELHVKIEGSFEAAIVGQKDYDGVSSASVGGSSSNKNSAVTVYGALVKKDTIPEEKDWEELDHLSQIQLEGSKCAVSIVPDTEHGTSVDSDSGMKGVYMTLSSELSLNGTPKDAGQYLISVTIADNQGRTATSNTLPFRIYSGEETLADQINVKNLKQYASGLYAWDIMEPWAIKNFGSNVAGEEESVRVPKDLEVWFGSHESGTYGYLGYDLPWKQVEKGEIPQTLYIPDGCQLTMTNMEILSSVRIVVEKGGKLTLSDSAVQGIIEVKDGGTFSMNYDSYSGKFKTGASICGQLRLENGAVLENAAIYSHINYLANGDLTDRSSAEPVVMATGNVIVKGQVFIKGDSAGTEIGQTALRVKNGTLTLEDGATLATYGGDGHTTIYPEGGVAIELDNGTITGSGKLIAIGGDVTFGQGGTAVSGNGTISTAEVFLQGATSYTSKNAAPGKAVNGKVKITSKYRHVEDGTQIEATKNDPLADLYWKAGIDAVPPMDKFVTEEYIHEHEANENVWESDSEKHWNPCKDDSCEEHLNEAAHTFVWVIDKQATAQESGLKHEKCIVCGYTRNEKTVIDKLSGDNNNNNGNGNGNTGDNSNNSSNGSSNTGDNSNNGNGNNNAGNNSDNNSNSNTNNNSNVTVASQNDWQKVNSEVVSSNTKGGKVLANEKADDVVPAYVLESLKGKDTYLTLLMPNGVSWNIYGKNITADTLKDIDLGVVLNSNAVPAALKSNVSAGKDAMEISLNYDGEFGFQTTLTIPAGKEHAGMYVKVYYYNEAKGSMDYITSGKVDANGNVNITLTHASDYVLVFDTVGIVQTGDQAPYVMILLVLLAGVVCIAAAMKKRIR